MSKFKYNMSFYYQSTIIYFVVFALYIIIRGEFVENSFTLITRDPIIYFFGIIVLISIAGLLYNLYRQKHIEVSPDGIAFISRSGRKFISFDDILGIKVARERRTNRPLKLVRIKLKNRRRIIIVRTSNYENEQELLKRFKELKEKLEGFKGL